MKELLTDVIPLNIKPEMLNENVNGGKMLIKGVLQTANKRNQNDRVYPKEVLKREYEKYLTEFVKQRRGMGELDHPQCFSPTAEILTNSGWKFIKDITEGEFVPTLNTDTNLIEYHAVEKVINEKYTGKMISIVGENINTLVTPTHRFIIQVEDNSYLEITAEGLLSMSNIAEKIPMHKIPTYIHEEQHKNDDLNIVLDFSKITISEQLDYDGTVHCVSVTNKNFYCRDNGTCFWTGNSEVVNLKNVSHTVIDMEWDNDNLIGTIEILPTPSGEILKKLIQSNILLGISSRGVGSVKQDMREGTNIVQDDFNLICFDIVSNPSTYGAFMKPMELNENKSYSHDIPQLNPHHKKIDQLLRNIISEL